jgi:hypothetical protein
MTPFESEWWSITPPKTWEAREDDTCATFTPPVGESALQISAARKESDPISVEEIQEFAEEQVEPGTALEPVRIGTFGGLRASFIRKGQRWDAWWLSQGRLLVFATFIRPMTDPDHELTHVSHSLATLTAARSAV